MENLLKFLSKYHLIFLFLFLEIIAVFVIVQNNRYHKAGFINSANFVSGATYSATKNVSIYFNLKEENRKLAEENASLRNEVKTIETIIIPSIYSDSLVTDSLFQDTVIIDSLDNFHYLPALTISNSINKKYNYIYLDKGLKDGFHNDMGVIESNGIVGVIVNSTNSYSMVMPLINEKSKLSVKIKNQGYFGTLEWQKGDVQHSEIKEIPKHVLLNKGDTIVTSGYSQIFPKNMLIGFVEEAYSEKGSSFLKIKIRLSVDFSRINYIYAIDNSEREDFNKIKIE